MNVRNVLAWTLGLFLLATSAPAASFASTEATAEACDLEDPGEFVACNRDRCTVEWDSREIDLPKGFADAIVQHPGDVYCTATAEPATAEQCSVEWESERYDLPEGYLVVLVPSVYCLLDGETSVADEA